MIPFRAIELYRDTIRKLVEGEYDSIEADGRAGRLGSEQLRWAVNQYGRKLINVPDQGLANAHCYSVDNAASPTWIIEIELWTEEEGMSDLTLSTVLTEIEQDRYRLEITDLHVL